MQDAGMNRKVEKTYICEKKVGLTSALSIGVIAKGNNFSIKKPWFDFWQR